MSLMGEEVFTVRPRPVGSRVAGFLLAGLLLLGLAGPAGAAGKGRKAPVPRVGVFTVTEMDTVAARTYVGHVEAIQSVDLRARVEGFLEKVDFREGNTVKAGKLLYLIEQAPYEARVKACQADVAAAEAEVSRTGQHLQRLEAARPESVRATDLDNARAAVASSRAALEAARAALVLAELDLGYTRITAPITGRIGRTAYTRGNLVNPASGTLARIVQTDPVWVMYSVSENEVEAIRRDLAASRRKTVDRRLAPRLRLGDGQPYPEPGRVDFVDNEVDPKTGTIVIRARFKNPRGWLIPGQYVTVEVKAGAPKLRPVVPQAAVMVGKQGRYVLVVGEDRRVTARPIVIGPVVGIYWSVVKGLKPGEKVVLHGLQKVRPGQQVIVNPASAQTR